MTPRISAQEQPKRGFRFSVKLRMRDGKMKDFRVSHVKLCYLNDAVTWQDFWWRLQFLARGPLATFEEQPPKTREWLQKFKEYYDYMEKYWYKKR